MVDVCLWSLVLLLMLLRMRVLQLGAVVANVSPALKVRTAALQKRLCAYDYKFITTSPGMGGWRDGGGGGGHVYRFVGTASATVAR